MPWTKGIYKDFTYEAKVYDEPSNYGINKGKVSKLQVKLDDNIIANYDRGWDVYPSSQYKKDVKKIVSELEL